MARRKDLSLERACAVLEGLAAPAKGPAVLAEVVCEAAVRRYARSNGLDTRVIEAGRLSQDAARARQGASPGLSGAVEALLSLLLPDDPLRGAPIEILGGVYEWLLELRPAPEGSDLPLTRAAARKASGSFFTPPDLADGALAEAFRWAEPSARRVCDPAVGAGAFLLAAARVLVDRGAGSRGKIVAESLYGVDIAPLAVKLCEASLALWSGDAAVIESLERHLQVGDALFDPHSAFITDEGIPFDFQAAFPEVFTAGGFDLVVGNPPWVAFAGRAAKPLSASRRQYYARRFRAFRGYPTLQALFVERALELAPGGVIALVLPSPIADLDGYAPLRRTLAATHTVREPLLELGQDAFARVTQPSFVLVATAGADPQRAERRWRLRERSRAAATSQVVEPPAVLEAVRARHAPFPKELFGELGFQSAGEVRKLLLSRATQANAEFSVPMLEGKNVREFWQGPPRLFLNPDPEVLARFRCRLRPIDDYARARFVIRQTASFPIAALHGGLPFRNSLLAGFDHPELPPAYLVALLNSTLYRALHLAARRDARQSTFPQLKVAHLRALPRPPDAPAVKQRLCELTAALSRRPEDDDARRSLDAQVFELFEVAATDRDAVVAFLKWSRGGSNP